jgi:hypothetical protein
VTERRRAERRKAFLEEATRFCNERVWGTLSATIIVHPSTLQAKSVNEAFERAVAEVHGE